MWCRLDAAAAAAGLVSVCVCGGVKSMGRRKKKAEKYFHCGGGKDWIESCCFETNSKWSKCS